MQSRRDKTTLGIALLVAVVAVIGNAYPWISIPLIVLAVLIIAWGRDQRGVESLAGSLPAGKYILKGLHWLDSVISPFNEQRAKLQDFYVAVEPIITRSLPADISETDFDTYVEEANTWATNCADWIAENMGEPAKARFLDRTYILAIHPRGAVNETHIEIIRNLARFRQNLLVLIESDAWDKVG
jgi:hypothetical protein